MIDNIAQHLSADHGHEAEPTETVEDLWRRHAEAHGETISQAQAGRLAGIDARATLTGTGASETAWGAVRKAGANAGLVLLALAWLHDRHGFAEATPGAVSRLTPFAESTVASTLRALHRQGLVVRRRGPHQRVTYRLRRPAS